MTSQPSSASLVSDADGGQTETSQEFARRNKANPLDLFRTPEIRKRILIGGFLWFTSSMVFFALSLGASNLAGDIFINSALLGLVEIPAFFVCMWSINYKHIGRRISVAGFFLIAGIFCLASVPVLHIGGLDTLFTVFSLVGKMGIAACFNIVFVYTPDFMPTELRSQGTGLMNVCARVSGMLAPYAGNMLKKVWLPLPSLIFGILGTSAGIAALFLPETLNKKLPDTIRDIELK